MGGTRLYGLYRGVPSSWGEFTQQIIWAYGLSARVSQLYRFLLLPECRKAFCLLYNKFCINNASFRENRLHIARSFLSLSLSLLFFLQEKNLENIQPSRHYILSEICSFLHFILVLVNLPKSSLGRLS